MHKILYPLAYYKSHDYVLENKIKDIYGILITIDNSKLKNKHIKKLPTMIPIDFHQNTLLNYPYLYNYIT